MRVACLLLAGCGRIAFDARGDAAPGDVARGDASDGQARACAAHASALFCEDFESSLAQWTIASGSPTIASTPTHSGNGALYASVASQPDKSAVLRTMSLDLPELHVRAWFYAPTVAYAHANLLDVNTPTGQGTAVYGFAGNLNLYRDTGTQVGGAVGPPLPVGAWHCVELHLVVHDTQGAWQLALDGQTVIDETNLDTRNQDATNLFYAGITYTGATQSVPATVYLDDIVVDVTPIGCTP